MSATERLNKLLGEHVARIEHMEKHKEQVVGEIAQLYEEAHEDGLPLDMVRAVAALRKQCGKETLPESFVETYHIASCMPSKMVG